MSDDRLLDAAEDIAMELQLRRTGNAGQADTGATMNGKQYFDGIPAEQIREKLKFADLAGATVNQLVEKERLLNQKLYEADQKIAHEEGRQQLRSAKDIVLREYPEFDDEQLYQQVLVPFDSQLAQQYPNAAYLPRLREAAQAGRRYLRGRNGAELDSEAWIADRRAEQESRGHSAPPMQSQGASPPEEVDALDYVATDEERRAGRAVRRMAAERLRSQGRSYDEADLEDDEDE